MTMMEQSESQSSATTLLIWMSRADDGRVTSLGPRLRQPVVM